jgi:TolA-binding protein
MRYDCRTFSRDQEDILSIFIFIVTYLSISVAAQADQPPQSAKALKNSQAAVISTQSAERSKNLKPSQVAIRQKKAEHSAVRIESKVSKSSPSKIKSKKRKHMTVKFMKEIPKSARSDTRRKDLNPSAVVEKEKKPEPFHIEVGPEDPKPSAGNLHEKDFRYGMQYYRERKYPEAISALSRYASVTPKSQQRMAALLIIGKSLEEMNRLQSALNIYSAVVETAPESPEALLGIVAMADISVANPDMKYNIGRIGGDYIRDPVGAYDFVLSKNAPSQILEHIHYQRGTALWKTKRYKEAHEALSGLLKKFPHTSYREETVETIIKCTGALINQYFQSGDHIAVADLFLQDWENGFVRPDDFDLLMKSSCSLYCLGLYAKSSDILNTLKKNPSKTLRAYNDKIDMLALNIAKKTAPAPYAQTPADIKWTHFQSGREYLAANQPTLAEEALIPLRPGDSGDPFWPRIADYAVEDYQWTKKYKEQIEQ